MVEPEPILSFRQGALGLTGLIGNDQMPEMVTDFDCWHPDRDAVTVQDIIKVFMANADKAKRLAITCGLLQTVTNEFSRNILVDGFSCSNIGFAAREVAHLGPSETSSV
jgi:hypothetical protein